VIDNSTGNVSTTGVTGAALQGSSSAFTGIDVASHDGGSTPVSTGTASLTAFVPEVTSIDRVGSALNNGSSEAFTVTFSENVTGVDATDFTAAAGNTVTDTSISVTAVSASVYTVTVNGVTGDGSLGVNLNATGTGIADTAGTAVPAASPGRPIRSIIPRRRSLRSPRQGLAPTAAAANNSPSLSRKASPGSMFRISPRLASGASDTGVSAVTGSGSTYTVTVGGVSGTGTLGLDLNASGTAIHDLAGNAIAAASPGATMRSSPLRLRLSMA